MTTILLPQSHYFSTSCPSINELCQSLFTRFKIQIFVYGKYYSDGHSILLSNSKEWLEYHLAKGYLVPAPIPLYLLEKKEAYNIICSHGSFQKAKYDLVQRFNSDQAIDFIFKGQDFYEVLCFSFRADDLEALNTIVNYRDELKELAFIFKSKAAQLLYAAENNKILIPPKMMGIDFSKAFTQISVCEGMSKAQYQLKQLYNKNFSPRQIDVLLQTIRGKSAKEIAIQLGLSSRTIEHYLVTIKNKIGVSSKSELIATSIDSLKHLI